MANIFNKFFGVCNLCHGMVIRINKSYFGYRCVKCRSTQIHRALGDVVNAYYNGETSTNSIRVYELSSRGAFVKFLKGKFEQLTFSEYYDDVKPGDYKNGVQCQDVQNLTFDNETFELVTSTEVFEHVADDFKGFQEVFRVLKKGGRFIFTVPLFEKPETVTRAYINETGTLVHLLPPEYHGDRIRGQNNVLAFRNYGQDIADKLKKAGFSEVKIIKPLSNKYKITHKEVIVAEKL